MLPIPKYLTASIGKKQILALTAFGLVGFTITHLLGNFLLFLGPDAFNTYAYKLTSNPLIYVAEAILLLMFITHIKIAVWLQLENRAARPQKYAMKVRTGRGETFASSTMPYTGMILLVFIILHLINFKYGTHYETTVDDIVMRDLYRLVVEYFSNIFYVAWYVIAMCALGLHTSHGVHSMFQSLGLNHPKYTPHIKTVALLYGVFVAIGFSSLAIFCHFQN